MTTNQTIDGVLVRRLLLEKLVEPGCESSVTDAEWDELRALLDAPADPASALNRAWQAGYDTGYYAKNPAHERPAAQPQGEPVGFRYRANNEPWVWMDESPFADGRHHYKQGYEELEPLYAEQPAPVAVVLPERKPIPEVMMATWHESKGWNACLDEVKRMNP